jgi:hypothetical protein
MGLMRKRKSINTKERQLDGKGVEYGEDEALYVVGWLVVIFEVKKNLTLS